MSGAYWQPRYKRQELSEKKNQNGRKSGKKTNKEASNKVLWDRYLQARKEIWKDIVWEEESRQRWEKYYQEHPDRKREPYRRFWNWIEDHFKKVDELEKEFIRRENELGKR